MFEFFIMLLYLRFIRCRLFIFHSGGRLFHFLRLFGTGCVIFAVGCGVITSVIRIWGNYPEGVSFVILFMNALVPLIDKASALRPFGHAAKPNEVAK